MTVSEKEKKSVNLKNRFIQQGMQQGYWTNESKILVAVSGGVDSMVLLDWLLTAQQQMGFALGVVHVDHQLRSSSAQEADFLAKYCQAKQLPFYLEIWPQPVDQGVETAARKFRYQVFDHVMRTEDYDILMTAHHGDDQIETILMKLLRSGQLRTYAGIKALQRFSCGRLIRPLLPFSKEELYQYAATEQIPFFEDYTNKELTIQRNRLRHLVIPQLKKEDPQTLQHFQKFSQQLSWADQFIQQQMNQRIAECIEKLENVFVIPWSVVSSMEQSEQYFFLYAFFDWAFPTTHVAIKEKQIESILTQFAQSKGQWQIDIGRYWVFEKVYEEVRLRKKEKDKESWMTETTKIQLVPNQTIPLSETERIGIYTPEKLAEASIDDSLSVFMHDLWVTPEQTLFVSRRSPGDRIRLTDKLTKKVSRYFIDQKIPSDQRMRSWVIKDNEENLLSLIPFTRSYLSISAETDKIHYILLYKYQKEAIGRRT
ncbi:tRNA lysidine(34) synthetase TilS [Enterococcus hirae]|nr:tRNA lysidine(34) synthetase TilS [Enterococcus hirae]